MIRIKSPEAKRVVAEYLKNRDPGMLEFLAAMRDAFGAAEEIEISEYEGLREMLEERAAIRQHDGGQSKQAAERAAMGELR